MIAFLGWGSLIWNPKNLPVQGDWQSDGPEIHVEFKRQSRDGRLTLVLTNDATPVKALWAIYDGDDVNDAKNALREREDCNIRDIGSWKIGDENPKHILGIEEWAKAHNIAAVIWTMLPAKFKGENGREPSLDEAVEYIRKLDDDKRLIAEEYVRKAPSQIKTEFRKIFEDEFGWHCENEKLVDSIMFDFQNTLKEAQQENVLAQFKLGRMYADGSTIPRNLAQAEVWYRKAAEQGLAEAQFELGNIYADRDDVQAEVWYRKAAEQGDADAQYILDLLE